MSTTFLGHRVSTEIHKNIQKLLVNFTTEGSTLHGSEQQVAS